MKIISPLKLHKVNYIENSSKLADVRELIKKSFHLIQKKFTLSIQMTIYWRKELKNLVMKNNISLHVFDNSSFINRREDLTGFFREEKVKFFQTSFYKKEERKNIIF